MPAETRCVYCRARPADPAWRPFCSERCKMADLGRWLGGHYRVPGGPAGVPAMDALDESPDDLDGLDDDITRR